MIVLTVDPNNPDPAAIRAAADAIRRGELVIFPTETVYGLAADALSEDAIRLVFDAKGRDEGNPLPVQVAGVEQLAMVTSSVPDSARALAAKYWPGPLTIVLPKNDSLSDLVTAGRPNVGVRVPDHKVALALLRELGSPIIASSANISGNPAPTTAQSAIDQVGEGAAIVLDAGECRIGVASTVVDLSTTPPRILRSGVITDDEIRAIVGSANGSGEIVA